MSSRRVLLTIRRTLHFELLILFFVQGAAMAMWFVPLTTMLEGYGLSALRPYAYATSAAAALISPLMFGAIADRHASPVKVLRGLAFATAISMVIASTAIQRQWNPWMVLLWIQVHALCSAPAWSIAASVVFSRLTDARKEFGPVRAMATIGWMTGCWVVSALNADASTLAGYSSAVTWIIVGAITCLLRDGERPKVVHNLTIRQRLGWDALSLLRNRDHRVVFIMTALFSIPLTAFYPYTPPQLRELGFENTSAWMSLGQATEIIAMFVLGGMLAKWRLKWIFTLGLVFGVLRFAFSAFHEANWLLLGVLLHGASYTLIYITAQIYLEQRVDAAWRARAQALLSLMNSGVGNLIGYLSTGWWFAASARPGGGSWPVFWTVLAIAVAGVFVYFLSAYRGIGRGLRRNGSSGFL